MKVVQDLYEDGMMTMCSWSNIWVQGVAEITPRISVEPFLKDRGQRSGVSMICSREKVEDSHAVQCLLNGMHS